MSADSTGDQASTCPSIDDLAKAALADIHTSRLVTPPPPPDQTGGASRTADCVIVSGKDLVMQVLLDVDANYSVAGYAERMRKSFGQIYLGLDAGEAYYTQSTRINQAIGSISEEDAFQLAFDETCSVLQALPDPTAFDIQKVSDAVLARLCNIWFDLPDEVTMLTGGWSVSDLLPPARCPGDFSAPSGYIFRPDPGILLAGIGQRLGHLLKDAVDRFVAGYRASGSTPRGALSSVIFDTFPQSSGQDDLLARTIIGVMMGMLPTAAGNLVAAVSGWQKDGSFAGLQRDFGANPEPDLHLRACATLKKPLMRAMQLAPVPDYVWRTAKQDQALGPVQVKAGDIVQVHIAAATREDLSNNVTDVDAVFGGDRSRTPHPTHACPGYAMAMGVLLGVIAALMSAQAAPEAQS